MITQRKKIKSHRIAFLYPRISHYREEFFEYFISNYNTDIYVYESIKKSKNNNFQVSSILTKKLNSISFFSKFTIFNFLPLLHPKYKIIILSAEMRLLPIWILLIFAKLTSKKTILWGHGISIYNYLEEEKKLNSFRVFFHRLADHIWLYTEKEKKIWENYLTKSKLTALNNTINIEDIMKNKKLNKSLLKVKYNIATDINFIYSARFSMLERRTDLLVKIIESLNKKKYGFIIIGDGVYKPDFSMYDNVYDFGTVYDSKKKNELFQLADLYLQAGWIGLSCNEALAYGKPVLTFKRSSKVLQCVEYSYLNNKNSYIANNMQDMLLFINTLDDEKIKDYQINSRLYAKNHLQMGTMINNAKVSLDKLFMKDN